MTPGIARWPHVLSRITGGWRRILAFALAGVVGAGTLAGVGYARTPLPTRPQDGVTDQGSVVYYADGTTPILRMGANREVVPHDRIPDHLRWAVLAAEDRGFYDEPGVSPRGMARALWSTSTGRQVQGGSTVTQQLARNYYRGLDKDRNVGRKLREIFVSVKLDRNRTKDEILDLYLNTVFFGRQASGVQAAARAYFHKPVWELTVAESAMLAAMIQRPAYFRTQGDDPPARALRSRWRYVIEGMVATGRLGRTQAAGLAFPVTRDEWTPADPTGQSLFIRQRVQEELARLGIPMERVVNGGLKIYTGLDRRWMGAAARAVRQAGEATWRTGVRGGLVAVDPRDGTVRAFYGGDPERSQYDTVFNPIAQAGSTFKPYALAAALRKGYSVRSRVDGGSPRRFAPDGSVTPLTAPGYLVDNDEKIGSLGTVDLVRATALSVNTGYVKLGLEVGIDNVIKSARDLGLPPRMLEPFRGQAGITLGTATIPAVRQAAGYAAFANGGTPVTPHLITRVVDPHGRTVAAPRGRAGRRVLGTEQVAQLTYALRAVVTQGTGTRAALADRPVAGKTGTTDGNRAAWFVGYVPQLSTAVVLSGSGSGSGSGAGYVPTVGRPGDESAMDGGALPAGIWRTFMAEATASLPVRPFPVPAFTGRIADWTPRPQDGGPLGGGPPSCGPRAGGSGAGGSGAGGSGAGGPGCPSATPSARRTASPSSGAEPDCRLDPKSPACRRKRAATEPTTSPKP